MRLLIILLLSVITTSCYQGRLNLAMDPKTYIPINGELTKHFETACGDIETGIIFNSPSFELRYELEIKLEKIKGKFDLNEVIINLNGEKQNFEVWFDGRKVESNKLKIKGKSNYIHLIFGSEDSKILHGGNDEIEVISESSIATANDTCGFGPIFVMVEDDILKRPSRTRN